MEKNQKPIFNGISRSERVVIFFFVQVTHYNLIVYDAQKKLKCGVFLGCRCERDSKTTLPRQLPRQLPRPLTPRTPPYRRASSESVPRMTDLSMTEISKGVWVPCAAKVSFPVRTGLRRENAEAGTRYDEVHPLEPVAAVTYAQAREYAEGMAARGLPRREAGTVLPVAEWNDVPDTTQPPRQAVFNCVKRYLFIKNDDKLIIEVELMSGTTLRHIIKVSQVKGILTKGHTRPYAEGQRPEKEVIIDLRTITCPGYAPEQLKFKLSGDENALAFQMALIDAL
jgi:hypothetical protein